MSDKKRHSRIKRTPEDFKVSIMPRDLEVIKEVLDDGFLTTKQIQSLFFSSSTSAIRRLQKLWNNGYLKRSYPVAFPPLAVYSPTRKGINLLVEEGVIEPDKVTWQSGHNRVKSNKTQHELEANEIKVALTLSVREREDVEIILFDRGGAYWDRVKDPNPDDKEGGDYIPIRPDRFLYLRTEEGYVSFFVEVDRGTKPLSRFGRKIRGYREYYFSGGFFKKYGEEGKRIEDYPFRVLTTALSEERRNNLVEQAIKEGSLQMCWFGVFSEVIANPLGKVWVRGSEYKEVLEQIPPQKREGIWGTYNKQERNKIIREEVELHSILE